MRLAAPLCFLLACSGSGSSDTAGSTTGVPKACDDGAPPDTYVAGIARSTLDGREVRIVDANPAPPEVGLNAFTLEVDGAGSEGVRLRPWMPLHGHGTSPEWYEATVSGTQSQLDGVDLFMPGLWVLSVTIGDMESDDGALFRFCLEG